MTSRGAFGIVALAALAAAAGGVAASRPALSLTSGQIRWFVPHALHTGDVVRCAVGSRSIDVKLAAPGTSNDTLAWKSGGVFVQVERQPSGATEIACGTSLASFRRPALPYVIGQNGVGLIRGGTRLASLERLFGTGFTSRTVATTCIASWPAIKLEATFAAARCTSSSALRSATVSGPFWSSLRGVRVGDSVARMRWQATDARLVSSPHRGKVWLLAGARSSGSKLLAIIGPAGTVTELVAVIG